METKSCGCFVGFCRVETLRAAMTDAIMAGQGNITAIQREYYALGPRCVGGFRATPLPEEPPDHDRDDDDGPPTR